MNRFYVLKVLERARTRALEGVSVSTRSSIISSRFWSRSNAFSSSPLREKEREVSGAKGEEQTRVTERGDDDERSLRRKEEPQNKFLESLRRETVENLEQLSDAEEDFKPPTRTFSLREKTFREKRELNMLPKEINGPRGLEPTRFKDWEVGGRCTDF